MGACPHANTAAPLGNARSLSSFFYFFRVVMTAAMMDPVAMMIPEMISMPRTSFPSVPV
ncbi:hypothetical protein J7I94_32165 [Streptomyces sp. ISL-12]|uniref:hypothetical protein n=1 Tax=Streptomyces sp. ISL-12 TaxID=2819177 RepID=UPI001BECCD83|nr:hypothetical protein [Streptomyces sp. ISL-12]MBT2415141.1 hypothetical protein [Streptomyces sp. ISL-12]